MTKIGLTGISADLSRRFAPLYLPGLPLSGSSARIPAAVGFFALFSPKRKSEKRESKGPVKNGTALLKNGTAPHHLAPQGASPRGEALTQGKASHFCRRKFCFQNFMQARGSLGTRQTIFASLCASTMRQGEALECCRKMKFTEFFSGEERL